MQQRKPRDVQHMRRSGGRVLAGDRQWHGCGTWKQVPLHSPGVSFTRLPEGASCLERVEARQNEIEVRHRAEVAALHERLRFLEDRVRRLDHQLQVHERRPTDGVADELGRHGNRIVTCVRDRCGRRFVAHPGYRHEYCCSYCRKGMDGHTRRCESTRLPAEM